MWIFFLEQFPRLFKTSARNREFFDSLKYPPGHKILTCNRTYCKTNAFYDRMYASRKTYFIYLEHHRGRRVTRNFSHAYQPSYFIKILGTWMFSLFETHNQLITLFLFNMFRTQSMRCTWSHENLPPDQQEKALLIRV